MNEHSIDNKYSNSNSKDKNKLINKHIVNDDIIKLNKRAKAQS